MYQLAPHQIHFSEVIYKILKQYNICFLAGEGRSRKTLTVFKAAELFGVKSVLIVTKKRAMPSILSDFNNFNFNYTLEAINYESLHKIKNKYDLIIYDESHSLSAYSKPSLCTKLAKKLFYNTPCILMSGTPATESYSQFYHQFYVSAFSPFKEYSNFYKWAIDFVAKKELRLATHKITDYSDANVNKINEIIDKVMVKMTQADAGITSTVNENVVIIKTPPALVQAANKLIKDKVLVGKEGMILGDMPAKLQGKVHQLINGHCIIEQNNGQTLSKIFSTYKADYIFERFKDEKIAIMYYYQSELKILKSVFKDITTDVEVFNATGVNIAVQQSSTEGQNLSKADAIVYFNLGLSGKNYIQSRDRLTVKDRLTNEVYFICESYGMTKKILETVREKKDFNTAIFKKWLQNSNQN